MEMQQSRGTGHERVERGQQRPVSSISCSAHSARFSRAVSTTLKPPFANRRTPDTSKTVWFPLHRTPQRSQRDQAPASLDIPPSFKALDRKTLQAPRVIYQRCEYSYYYHISETYGSFSLAVPTAQDAALIRTHAILNWRAQIQLRERNMSCRFEIPRKPNGWLMLLKVSVSSEERVMEHNRGK